jgi:hypothetical protein
VGHPRARKVSVQLVEDEDYQLRYEHRNAACVKSGGVLRCLLVLCLAFKRVVPGSVNRAG